MAIDSTTRRSPGANQFAAAFDDEEDGTDDTLNPEGDEEEDEEDSYGAVRESRPRKGSLLSRLIAQIDDINLARYLDEETLRKIGMTVVREFEIDENSRADWVDGAEQAMKFAMQKSEPKEYPWPGASHVIFPLISQAAAEFNARTYPAIVMGRKIVKGVVWGSDKGTPALEDGKPKMTLPPPQPGMGAPANAMPGAPNPGAPAPAAPAAPPGPASPTVGPGAPSPPQGGPPAQPEPVWLIAPGEKRQRADRVGEHMSWQLLEEMPEWEEQTDQLLFQIPVVGGGARKTFRDVVEGRNSSLFVSLINLVWNYGAPSFSAAPRITEKVLLYPHEIEDFERIDMDENDDGMFLPLNYGPGDAVGTSGTKFGFRRDGDSGGDQSDPDAPHLFLEQHRRWDLDDDGYAEPYIVTVHERSAKVVRIVARYDKDGIKASKNGDEIHQIKPVDHYTLIPFFPSIDGGSYPMGFGHYLRGLNDQINSTLNQMFDAGHLQNAGGGFIGDNLNAPSGQTLFQVGKYVRVTTKGATIRDSVLPLPFAGPSPVLFQLLGLLLDAGKSFASLQNVLDGDASMANASPTTVLALIEQGMKMYTAIHKRIYRAFKSEFAKLYRLNRIYITEPEKYQLGDDEREIHPSDYRMGGGVVPVADPKMVTDMQRLGRAEILMSFKDDPLVNQIEIRQRMFEAADIDRIEDLMVPPSPVAQIAQQLEIQTKLAELGRIRAEEQKAATQAFLNLALARKNASAQEEQFLEDQLSFMRTHLEAVRTEVMAADVAGKHRAIALDHINRIADRAHEMAMQKVQMGVDPGDNNFPVMPDTPAPVGPDVTSASSPGTGTPAVPNGAMPGA